MALLYVFEYQEMGRGMSGNIVPAPHEPSVVNHTPIDFTAGEAKSVAFGANTRYVLITADADCHILFGADPTATTTDKPIWEKLYAGFGVTRETGMKISVIGA
jgi:hypothetical protein